MNTMNKCNLRLLDNCLERSNNIAVARRMASSSCRAPLASSKTIQSFREFIFNKYTTKMSRKFNITSRVASHPIHLIFAAPNLNSVPFHLQS